MSTNDPSLKSVFHPPAKMLAHYRSAMEELGFVRCQGECGAYLSPGRRLCFDCEICEAQAAR